MARRDPDAIGQVPRIANLDPAAVVIASGRENAVAPVHLAGFGARGTFEHRHGFERDLDGLVVANPCCALNAYPQAGAHEDDYGCKPDLSYGGRSSLAPPVQSRHPALRTSTGFLDVTVKGRRHGETRGSRRNKARSRRTYRWFAREFER
jgi:hypothetical protein